MKLLSLVEPYNIFKLHGWCHKLSIASYQLEKSQITIEDSQLGIDDLLPMVDPPKIVLCNWQFIVNDFWLTSCELW
jgi:hypothetical protein